MTSARGRISSPQIEGVGQATDAQAPARPAKEGQAAPEVTAAVVKQQGESFEVPAEMIDGLVATQAGGRELREVVRVFTGGFLNGSNATLVVSGTVSPAP